MEVPCRVLARQGVAATDMAVRIAGLVFGQYQCGCVIATRPIVRTSSSAGLNLFGQTHPSFGASAPNQCSVITFFRV